MKNILFKGKCYLSENNQGNKTQKYVSKHTGKLQNNLQT